MSTEKLHLLKVPFNSGVYTLLIGLPIFGMAKKNATETCSELTSGQLVTTNYLPDLTGPDDAALEKMKRIFKELKHLYE